MTAMPDTFDARREQILDLWAAGLKTADIADRIGGDCCENMVNRTLGAGRRAGDPRAAKRGTFMPVPKEISEAIIAMAPNMTCAEIADALAAEYKHATEETRIREFLRSRGLKAKPTVVTLRRTIAVEPPIPPRPEDARYASLTAYLLGDPPIQRSALFMKMNGAQP